MTAVSQSETQQVWQLDIATLTITGFSDRLHNTFVLFGAKLFVQTFLLGADISLTPIFCLALIMNGQLRSQIR